MRLQVPGAPLAANVTGTVRWCGMSATHHCAGFGIEFDQQTPFFPSSTDTGERWLIPNAA